MSEIQYVKRYQMIFDFGKTSLEPAELPEDYFWIPWKTSLTDVHARTLYLSFQNELDALIFPTFNRFDSCLRLIRQCTSNLCFEPKATWLIAHRLPNDEVEYCATIQGLRSGFSCGAIQNVAVIAAHRHQGLGRALVTKSLEGFHAAGCQQITLEATVENSPAIRLYSGIGFNVLRTTYKETCFFAFGRIPF